jgi:diguanylate cyclase (GGDEF)-like protein/PAS domain S-box-containing protein
MFLSGKAVKPWLGRLAQTLLLALLLWLLVLLTLQLPYSVEFGALALPLWLPAGLALALGVAQGWRCWPGLLLGFALANTMLLQHGVAHGLALAVVQSLSPLLAAGFLRSRLQHTPPFYRLSRVLLFLWCGVLANTLLSVLLAHLVLDYSVLPAGASRWNALFSRWLGEVNGILVLTPPILFLLLDAPVRSTSNPARWLESALLTWTSLCLAVVEFIVADFRHGVAAALWPLFFIALMWVAFRCRLALAYCLHGAIVLLAFVGVLLHNGLAYQDAGMSGIAAAGMLLLVQSLALLVFGALVAERRFAEDWLRRANQTLEAKVVERTRQLAQSEARLKLMADASPFPMVMNNLDGGGLIYANAQAESLFKCRLDELQHRVQDFYVDQETRKQVSTLLHVHGAVRDHEVKLHDAEGRQFWALVSCSVVHSDQALYVISGINDISERKRLERSLQEANDALRQHVAEIESLHVGLREQVRRDPLTGLFNRRYLDEILPRLLAHMLALNGTVAVLMLDADHFKRINDNYGHQCGDAVLAALGAFLRDRFRSGDVVCRYGGEEFCILMPGIALEAASDKAWQLCEAVRQLPIQAAEHRLHITLSVGLSVCPLHGEDPESLIHAADAALYQAKAEGRDRVCLAHSGQPALS